MKDFETTCEELKIPLFVLPPASPKINGNVERMNRIITEEFLHETLEDSLVGLLIELNKFIDNYNTFRPHSSLQGYTPLLYIKSVLGDPFFVSHLFDLTSYRQVLLFPIYSRVIFLFP